MIKIICTPNCGNSPKMQFLKVFKCAIAEGNVKFLSECVTEDFVWDIIGQRKISGRERFIEVVAELKEQVATELLLDQILSHGKEGALSGITRMENGKTIAFSDFFQFNGAKGTKIRLMTSYRIEI